MCSKFPVLIVSPDTVVWTVVIVAVVHFLSMHKYTDIFYIYRLEQDGM
jgi:hypothetical protein